MPPAGASGDDTSGPSIGDILGDRYRLLGVLGRGGMGTVYRAEHVVLGGELAVKVLLPSFASFPEYLRRFRREGRAAMQLDHPHVVRVLDLGLDPPVPYLAMELVKGDSLGAWIDGVIAGHRPVAAVCELLAQIAGALGAAHDAGLVHRDLKPDNVLVEMREGRPFAKVVDFGLVHLDDREVGPTLTQADHVAGTPAYMSPEQCRSLVVEGAADLYALGCILHEALTGDPPFAAPSAIELIAKQIYVPAPALVRAPGAEPVPPELDALRRSLLAKDPADRPTSGQEVALRLRAIANAPTVLEPAGLTRGSRAPRGEAFPPVRRGAAFATAAAPSIRGTVALVRLAAVPADEGSALAVGLGVLGWRATALVSSEEAPPTEASIAVLDAGADVEAGLAYVRSWRHRSPDVPLVVCVAGLGPREIGAFVEAGAADAVRSPASAPLLSQRLTRCLRARAKP